MVTLAQRDVILHVCELTHNFISQVFIFKSQACVCFCSAFGVCSRLWKTDILHKFDTITA